MTFHSRPSVSAEGTNTVLISMHPQLLQPSQWLPQPLKSQRCVPFLPAAVNKHKLWVAPALRG